MRQDAILCRIVECLRLLIPEGERPKAVAPMQTGWLSDMAALPEDGSEIAAALGAALVGK